MDKQIQVNSPNYKQIFRDILKHKHPEKTDKCKKILAKTQLSAIDILEINNTIFAKSGQEYEKESQRLRAYSKSDIIKILDYQKKKQLNNSQLAKCFGLSRNTVTKWKKLFV